MLRLILRIKLLALRLGHYAVQPQVEGDYVGMQTLLRGGTEGIEPSPEKHIYDALFDPLDSGYEAVSSKLEEPSTSSRQYDQLDVPLEE